MYDFNIPQWQPQRPRREVEYVHGIESARMYRLDPGESAVLMDCDTDRFFFLRADAVGAVKVRAFSFSEEVEERAPESPEYVTRSEIAGIVREELERWSGNEQHD